MSFTITSMLETRNHALAIAKQMTTRPAPIPDHHADCFIGNHLLLQEQDDLLQNQKPAAAKPASLQRSSSI
jgi:hypothetical protein